MHTQYMMHSPRLVLEYSVNIKHVLPILICPDKWGPHCRILLKICPSLPCFWLEMLYMLYSYSTFGDKIDESYLGFFNQTLAFD